MDICLSDALKMDYLNGLLGAEDRILLEEHLASCQECRVEMEELRKTAVSVAELSLPMVPKAWINTVRELLRKKASPSFGTPSSDTRRVRQKTSFFLYTLISIGVTAALALLGWLVLGGAVHRWFPGLSATTLGITDPHTVRTINLAVVILSLFSLMLVPSIIDTIYLLVRRGIRMKLHGDTSNGSFR